jgi:glyoxylase I family protein
MSANIKTTGLHHLALRSGDLARSRAFYHDLLGFPLLMETPQLLILQMGNVALALKAPDQQTAGDDVFNPFRIGLDHLALAAESEADIDRVSSELRKNKVWVEGPKVDETLGKYYVAFKDPDGIKLEYYMI